MNIELEMICQKLKMAVVALSSPSQVLTFYHIVTKIRSHTRRRFFQSVHGQQKFFNDDYKAGPVFTQIRGRCLSEGGTIVEVLLQALKIQPTLPFGNRTCQKVRIMSRRSTG